MSTKNITMLRNVDDYVKGQSYQDVAAEQADELIKNGFAKEAEDHTDEVVKRITGAIKDERQYVDERFDLLARDVEKLKRKNPGVLPAVAENDDEFTSADFLTHVKNKDAQVLGNKYKSYWTVLTDEKDSEAKTKASNLEESTGNLGGFTVAPRVEPELFKVRGYTPIIEGRARVVPMDSREVDINCLDQTVTPVGGAQSNSAIYGGVLLRMGKEGGAIGQTNFAFKEVKIIAHRCSAYVVASNELLADSPVTIQAEINDNLGGAMAKFKDRLFFQGNGINAPEGLINAPSVVSVTRTTSNLVKATDIFNMSARILQDDYNNAFWVANPTVRPQLFSMLTGQMPIFVINAQDSAPMRLLGLPIFFTDNLPVLGSKADIALINPRSYGVGVRQGTTVAFSDQVAWLNNQSAWRVVSRFGARSLLAGAVTLDDGATTQSDIVVLAA